MSTFTASERASSLPPIEKCTSRFRAGDVTFLTNECLGSQGKGYGRCSSGLHCPHNGTQKEATAVEERRWVCRPDEQFMPQHESTRHHVNIYGKNLTTSYSSLVMAMGYLRLPHE